jgi:hypothetical protein
MTGHWPIPGRARDERTLPSSPRISGSCPAPRSRAIAHALAADDVRGVEQVHRRTDVEWDHLETLADPYVVCPSPTTDAVLLVYELEPKLWAVANQPSARERAGRRPHRS